jgi:hypothetical protein
MNYKLAIGTNPLELEVQVNALLALGYTLTDHGPEFAVSERRGYWIRELLISPIVAPISVPSLVTLSDDTKSFLQGLILDVAITAMPLVTTVQSAPDIRVRITNTTTTPVITDEKAGNP